MLEHCRISGKREGKPMIWISHLLIDEEMKELISQTGAGVESIEFSIAENLDRFDETLYSCRRRLEEMGCQSLTLHGPFLDLNPVAFDSLVQQATLRRYEQTYQAALELGAKKIIYHSCFVPSVYFLEGWAERAADFYNRFLENKTDEIQILMENVLDPIPDPFLQVAQMVKHPAFGICLDLGHVHCYSDVPCQIWMEQLQPYIRHLHLHDNDGTADEHLALGEGTLPLEKLKKYFSTIDGTIECRTQEAVRLTCDRMKA